MNKLQYGENFKRSHNLGYLLGKHPELNIEHDIYNINVTSNHGDRLSTGELTSYLKAHPGANKPAHLYFHVPLCNYICHFCNYVKNLLPSGPKREEKLDLWADLLIEESQRYLRQFSWAKEAKIESFFMGGGTAAIFRFNHLSKLLEHVRSQYRLSSGLEMTLEGNPDNFTSSYLQDAMDLGFNRFSMGVQALNDDVNEFVGRGHNAKMSMKAIYSLLATKKPFNIDMMFGLPYQTTESVEADIRTLVDLKVPTITIYRLRNSDREEMGIGNRSFWNKKQVRTRIQSQGLFPSLQQTYRMREAAVQVFLEAGYSPSPCGWWSAPGTYKNGNIPQVSKNKWQNYHTMIAFGPGAYGWLTGDGAVVQTHNLTDISKYVDVIKNENQLPLSFGRLLTGSQAVASRLGFAFKANQPILFDQYQSEFGVDILNDSPYSEVISELLEKELIEFTPDRRGIIPTLEGEALHEEIISIYFHHRIGSLEDAVCKRTKIFGT